MRAISAGVWKFALLLVLLLIIATLASISTVSHLEELFVRFIGMNSSELQFAIRDVVATMISLIAGFLFLAGAFGIWAIRSTSHMEGRRRVGRFVDEMDYLRDGLLVVDLKNMITGMNPAAHQMAAVKLEKDTPLRALFPCLSESDAEKLLKAKKPHEIERPYRTQQGLRTIRFRSQPSEDHILIILSDVTGQKVEEQRNRQITLLQLVGRIARGVAHDFNNILCAISGHASLLSRGPGKDGNDQASLTAILSESQRGATLASHLLELSRTGAQGPPCNRMADHVTKAVDLLRIGLRSSWQVIADCEDIADTFPLTAIQIEQMVLNLGLLSADELGHPGILHVRLRRSSHTPPFDPGNEFTAVIVISTSALEMEFSAKDFKSPAEFTSAEPGVIQSVVRSLLEEVGGRLDIYFTGEGHHSYRLCIPHQEIDQESEISTEQLPLELRSYLSNWHALLASPERTVLDRIGAHLQHLQVKTETTDNIVTALQSVEEIKDLNLIIFDKRMLGNEANALIRAVLKLRPLAGLVILMDKDSPPPESSVEREAVFDGIQPTRDELMKDMVNAREMASRRKRTS